MRWVLGIGNVIGYCTVLCAVVRVGIIGVWKGKGVGRAGHSVLLVSSMLSISYSIIQQPPP